ncbi:Hypothetical protein SRAE_2000413600 [Strongyloides ratti]|uniref:Uncharacterized protein n=1 Tax=Strongyloides ratti TaxID=34506 RepID=A0A090LIA7_STRRB|nr:Hypothetical protein SRAE_2000413600 [Strongyloides ratti]CEF69487.1 Hypothetical protein SRAE_2000413600 [Strongyloides ratti]
MNIPTKDKNIIESRYQYNVGPSNSQLFRTSRRSIDVSTIDEERRKKIEEKISVDMMRRLTPFDNRELVDFVGWLNTKDHTPKTTIFRTDRGNSIPEERLLTRNNEYYYPLNHQSLSNKSSHSSIDNSSGIVSLTKGKGSGDSRKNSQNFSSFEKKKFRASSITGGRSTNNNYAMISKKNSLQNNNNSMDGMKDRRKSLANFRSKSTNRRVSDAPVRNLL